MDRGASYFPPETSYRTVNSDGPDTFAPSSRFTEALSLEVNNLVQLIGLLEYNTVVHDQCCTRLIKASVVENVTWRERVTVYQGSSR